jgi:hypothetical protein
MLASTMQFSNYGRDSKLIYAYLSFDEQFVALRSLKVLSYPQDPTA